MSPLYLFKKSLTPMLITALSLITIIGANAHAIVIPIEVKNLGTTENNNNKETVSAYRILNDIIRDHHEYDAVAALLIVHYGMGLLVLVPSVIDETIHISPHGREFHMAKKLKALIIASSDQYVAGRDPFIPTQKKSMIERQNIYREAKDVFNKFYLRLCNASSSVEKPSKKEVKKIISRANKTGLLVAHSLLKKIINADSFSPLIFVFTTGQLLDRIEKIEEIIRVRDEQTNKLKTGLSIDFQNLFNRETSLRDKTLNNAVGNSLGQFVDSVDDFEFPKHKIKMGDYQLIK